MWRETLNHVEAKAFFAEVFKAKMSFKHLQMAYYFKNSAYREKIEVLAIVNFDFGGMTPKGFPELGQNPSGHLRFSNKSNNSEISPLEMF